MWRFILGLATGYLTLTDDGKKMTEKMILEAKKNANSFLKKEGVIEDEEPITTTRPTESVEPDDKPEERTSDSETVNE